MSAAPAYVPVPVDSFSDESAVDFDLYVQLNTKHVLYLRKGVVFDNNRLEKMREKKVRNVFILADDQDRYRVSMEQKAQKAYDAKSGLTSAARAMFIHRAQQMAIEELIRTPQSPALYSKTRDGAKKLTDLILADDTALRSLIEVQNPEKNYAQHGVAVAAIAVAIAKKIGLADAKDLHLLTLGCLLHDSGLKSAKAELLKPLKDLTPEQLKEYKEHTTQGVRLTEGLKHFDQHVINIMVEHHEYINGTGFPRGLRERDMHPYSLIAATANSFDRYVTFEGETLQGALKRMVIEKIGLHPLEHINALKAIISKL